MNPRTAGHALRAGDRIRLLSAGHWDPPLDAEPMALLQASVGGEHTLDSVDEWGFGWLAFELEPGHWHTFKLDPNDYELLD
jgi:hypothetical protein